MTRYSRYWTAFVTIFTKEFLRFARIWLQTACDNHDALLHYLRKSYRFTYW